MSFLALGFAMLFLEVLDVDPSSVGFPGCSGGIAASLGDFSDRRCRRGGVEPGTLGCWLASLGL